MAIASRLRTNVVANFVGRLSSMVLAILFTPIYVHFLGIEAYGLIGFYITLQSSIAFLEMGLSRACNRELAKLSGQGEGMHGAMRDTLRSLEVIYWAVAVLIGMVLSLASLWIATRWLHSSEFSGQALQHLVVIMAWIIALRWPMGIYSGALMGLQKQVPMNVLQVLIAVLNWAGSAAVLWLVRPDVQLFFEWQLWVALAGSLAYGVAAWRAMPGRFGAGRVSFGVVKGVMPFAAGVAGNAILGTIIVQSDKLVLSAMLPLKQFGYYALASVIAQVVAMLASPVSNAVFPRFSQMFGSDAPDARISRLYHLASQAAAVLIVPFALVVAFFAYPVLEVYMGSSEIAGNTAHILEVLVLAKLLHASMLIPYAMQLASGWVSLSLSINIASAICFVPVLYWLASIYGAIGAAMAWFAVATGYVAIGIPLMHRRLLRGEGVRWLWHSLVLPASVVGIFLWLVHQWQAVFPAGRWLQGLVLLLIGIAAVAVAVLASVGMRGLLWQRIMGRSAN